MSEGGDKKTEKLECPSGELTNLRKQLLVEKLMKNDKEEQPNGTNPIKAKKFKTLGPSSVLSRVKSFLPQMKEANDKLLSQVIADPSSISIEAEVKEEDKDKPLVEFNFALLPREDEDDDDSSEEEGTSMDIPPGQSQSLEVRCNRIRIEDSSIMIREAGSKEKEPMDESGGELSNHNNDIIIQGSPNKLISEIN